ncbi:ATP-binding protein [Nitriliruptor alkaliphilus]|uniref:ATP-binding protein n=1 Tax=Nitriliruptor alkaliphilus TaxID=427918 RepID=UPI000696098E|nr:AAA family ATPase [Nitriliruptor alkaliphilus]
MATVRPRGACLDLAVVSVHQVRHDGVGHARSGWKATSLILERDAEVDLLRSTLTDADRGHGSVVLIAGEAGIGKSSLVQAWREQAPADVRVWVGLCDDFLTSRTLGPFRDIARHAQGAIADAVGRSDTSAVLDAVLDELDHPLQVTLLVLEDVQWADEATLDVVRYVGRRIAGRRGVIAVTYRDDEVGPEHPLTAVLGVLPSEAVHRVHPRPLSPPAVALLTASTSLDPEAVLRVTAGNPFFVSELARDPAGIPTSVATSVMSRMRSLPADVRAALELLSVVPRPVRTSFLEAVLPDTTVLAAAEQRGLWSIEDDHGRFRHELTRQAVLDALPTSIRRRHHGTVLDRLLDTDADADAILHHAVVVGRGEVIVRYGTIAAAEAYRAGAHREAARHQEHVLAQAHLLDDDARAQLLEEHAWSLYHLHLPPRAVQAARQSVTIRQGVGPADRHARALCTLSRMAYLDNDPAEATAASERAVAVAGTTRDAEALAEARLARASLASLLDRRDAARAELEQVLVNAVELGRSDLESLALNYLGTCGPAPGETRELTADRFVRAIAIAREGGHLEAAGRAYTNLVSELAWHGDDRRLPGWYEEAVAFTSDHDFPSFRFHIRSQGCRHLIAVGRWSEAEATLRQLLEDAPDAGVLELMVLEGLARVLIRSGGPDAADVLDRAWRIAVQSQAAQHTGAVCVLRAEMAFLHGDLQEAQRIGEEAPLAELEPFTRGELLVYLARAGAAVADGCGPAAAPWALVLAGDVLAAAEAWAAVDNHYERALALLATDDEAHLLEAVQVLDRLGAAPAATLVRRRLRELGTRRIPRGPADVTRSDPFGLTARQREVLDLLGEGLTNAQIAERLVVSVRTVDHHVSAVLQKLGVANRQGAVEVAAGP